MDCIEAQALISETLDGSTVDREALEAAKQHCRECPDCAGFVRGLSIVKRAPLPIPPPDLVDNVMNAVRVEHDASQARAQAEGTAATGVAESELEDPPGDSVAAPEWPQPTAVGDARARSRWRLPTLAAWIGAAALLVAGAGVVGIVGVRIMAPDRTPASRTLTLSTPSADDRKQAPTAGTAAPESSTAAAGSGAIAGSGPSFVSFNAIAYRYTGVSDLSKDQLIRLGTTTSSLNGTTSKPRDVMGATGVALVYIEDDSGALLEFEPVTREYQGRIYQLRSAEIPAFGAWPTLIADVPQPTSSNGSPTFFIVGTDASGVQVYALTSSTAEHGIAVAPNTSATDPAAGNPGWTWWTPVP